MNITIIGLGLMGGSMAIDLRKRNFAKKIFGVDSDILHAETAKNIGLVDEIVDLETGINSADLIILATPVDATINMLPNIMNKIDSQIITDVCSTKYKICELIKEHPKRKNFVASHPMAGTEYSGPWAAISHLYDGKSTIICNKEESSNIAIKVVEDLYGALNMRIIHMDAKSHDVHAAYVSHISHISSFALALTVLEKEKDEKHIFNMAGGGFRSTVRLAKSSSDMWTPIFNQNSENIIDVLDTYISKLQEFKERISNNSKEEINTMILDANKIKRIIS
ncbi:MAG: prephenate dehydrogenase [Chlorobi bacterium]|nr:prephenate dehydrogenase [Chlorobiota bacterium]